MLLIGCLVAAAAWAQHPHEVERQRALMELDRRGLEFAAPLPPQAGQPLHPDPEVARQLRPYERLREAEKAEQQGGFVLRLPPPVVREAEKPLPLPGGREPGVDPVAVPGGRG